jgi:hypothetical protein
MAYHVSGLGGPIRSKEGQHLFLRHPVAPLLSSFLFPSTIYKPGFFSHLTIYHQDPNVATTPKANFGQLIFKVSPTIRRIVRKIETLSKKIINGEVAITLNIYIIVKYLVLNDKKKYIYTI